MKTKALHIERMTRLLGRLDAEERRLQRRAAVLIRRKARVHATFLPPRKD